MTRRPRLARLLDRFAAWLVADSIARWEALPQDRLDALIARGAMEDR